MPRLLGIMVAIIAIASLFTVPASAASGAAEPTQFIQSVTASVTEILKTKSGADREAAMRTVLRQSFDLPYMASATLGAHWASATAPQKARLLAAVEASEARAYSDRLGRFPGATIQVGGVTPKSPGVWTVDSRLLLPNGSSLKLDWEVRQGSDGLRISDVRAAGVSAFATRRADFDSHIKSHGGNVEPLIQVLEARATR